MLTSVQQEIAARRKANISRQDSRLSVKCLIESIENATKQAKAGEYNTILGYVQLQLSIHVVYNVFKLQERYKLLYKSLKYIFLFKLF